MQNATRTFYITHCSRISRDKNNEIGLKEVLESGLSEISLLFVATLIGHVDLVNIIVGSGAKISLVFLLLYHDIQIDFGPD